MQWNKPYPAGYEYNTFKPHQTIAIYPKVIGEGDVTSVLFPDGSIQSFFVPVTVRQDRWSPYHNLTNSYGHFQEPNPEYWFVRSISYTNPTAIYQVFNKCGDPLVPALRNSCCCVQPCQEYHQKFHNDSSTSTTDLCYFYPRLCQDRPFKFNEAIQTEFLNNCCNKGLYECPTKENYCKCNNHGSDSSTSRMSIDGDAEATCICSKHRKKNKKKSKNNVQCKCKKQSDKCVTTYVDQASGTTADENVSTSKKNKSKRHVKIRSLSKNSSKNTNTSCECSHSSCVCDSETD